MFTFVGFVSCEKNLEKSQSCSLNVLNVKNPKVGLITVTVPGHVLKINQKFGKISACLQECVKLN